MCVCVGGGGGGVYVYVCVWGEGWWGVYVCVRVREREREGGGGGGTETERSTILSNRYIFLSMDSAYICLSSLQIHSYLSDLSTLLLFIYLDTDENISFPPD